MKIYTKTGDKGETSLLGGTRVSKSDLRVELYGEIDELNSFIGSLQVLVNNDLLKSVQNNLFNLGSFLACEQENWDKFKLTKVSENLVDILEQAMDKMNSILPELKNFILPGGSEGASRSHLCRTITRRVERKLVQFSKIKGTIIPENSIKLMNRLSDYFFVYSRYLNYESNIKEVIWTS